MAKNSRHGPYGQEVRIEAEGAVLAGRLFSPDGPPRAAVLLSGATGVPQRYYRDFAHWLVRERGLAVLTYDYRDFGASQTGTLRASRANMTDWAVHDPQAARDRLAALYPDQPLWVIGHSVGALCLPLQRGLEGIARIVAVASGPVHLSDHPWHYRPIAAAFWHGPPRLATALLGYTPGRRLGLGADLPAGVYRQWRRWCLSRSFYAGDVGTALPLPAAVPPSCAMRVVDISDDPMIPPHVVWRLMAAYPETWRDQKVLHPAAYSLQRIGHLGAFHRRAAACWPDLIGPSGSSSTYGLADAERPDVA
ncbi:MAG: alpha/beta hydrolase [Litorimonas sp.]